MAHKIQQFSRIIVFSLVTFLPIIISVWCLTVLPEIIRNNLGYKEEGDQTVIASYFFTSFFYGLIIGSFIWPTLVPYTSKRNSIFYAVLIQGFFNAIQIYFNNIYWLCFCRFICGFFHNLNTVGKDFVFEFCRPEYRQYAFSFKSCFGIFASFVGPFIGYHIYQFTGKSFFLSSLVVSCFYIVALILFVIVFYFFYTPGEIEDRLDLENLLGENDSQNKEMLIFEHKEINKV